MTTTIEDRLLKAIEILAGKINPNIIADDALKFTQAAQNISNTICNIKHIEKNYVKGIKSTS